MTHGPATLAGLTVLCIVGAAPLAAQSDFGIRAMARAIGAVDYSDPVPHGGSLAEARIIEPVLMLMGHGFGSLLRFNGTLDLEGLTMKGGELTPGEWGEGFVDRRHPHTYVHELMFAVVDPLGRLDGAGQLGLALGKGFVPYGSDDPMSRPFLHFPVNHHLSQIPERAVGIVQYQLGPVTAEASLFDGDEPTGPGSWPLIRSADGVWRFGDSHALRVTVRPMRSLEVEGSLAHVHSPEDRLGAGVDDNKQIVSARWDDMRPTSEHYLLAEWARTSEAGGFFVFHTFLAEGMLVHGRWEAAYRFERTERPEEPRLTDPFRSLRPDPESSLLGITRWTLHTVHVAVDLFPRARGLDAEPFVEATIGNVAAVGPASFDPEVWYGTRTVRALSAGITLQWRTRGHRMGRYGVLGPTPAGMHM